MPHVTMPLRSIAPVRGALFRGFIVAVEDDEQRWSAARLGGRTGDVRAIRSEVRALRTECGGDHATQDQYTTHPGSYC